MAEYAHVSYGERASLYREEYVDTVDLPFLFGLITPEVNSILEIPSGVGRNVLNMARSGCPIMAVDREPEMVRVLNDRLAEEKPRSRVETAVGDLTRLDLGRTFDLIVVPREAYQLLSTPGAARDGLTCLKNHLSAAGRIVVDLSPFFLSPAAPEVLRPDYFDPSLPDGVWTHDWRRPTSTGAIFCRHHLQRQNRDGTLDVSFRYELAEPGGRSRRSETTTSFRIYSHAEFAALASSIGLQVLSCYGDYSGKPFEDGDPRMIFILALAASAGDAGSEPGVSSRFSDGFDNERHSTIISDFRSVPLRDDVVTYFRSYSKSNFRGPFVEGQGAEEILETMYSDSGSGRALDLGAGTSSLFWYLPARHLTSITCADIAPEPLKILHELTQDAEVPECYRWIERRFDLDPGYMSRAKQRISQYAVFDALSRWPAVIGRTPYDLITAFGTLSLCRDADQHAAAFAEIHRHLKAGGRTIGADWLRKPEFLSKHGHDNSFLTRTVVEHAIRDAGFQLTRCEELTIRDDPYYRAIVYWSAARR